ncbi:MAG: hypothetical protein PHG97_01565 [Candidatus Margulisbacteria bacterium]|nr:hypothetical protein [Candidatus Margulisiibacteriota bacterium]
MAKKSAKDKLAAIKNEAVKPPAIGISTECGGGGGITIGKGGDSGVISSPRKSLAEQAIPAKDFKQTMK